MLICTTISQSNGLRETLAPIPDGSKWRLEKTDGTVVQSDDMERAYAQKFTDLEDGEYTFFVKVYKARYDDSEEDSAGFSILPSPKPGKPDPKHACGPDGTSATFSWDAVTGPGAVEFYRMRLVGEPGSIRGIRDTNATTLQRMG